MGDDAILPVVKDTLRDADENVRLAVVNLLVQRRTLLRRLAPISSYFYQPKTTAWRRHAAFLLGKSGPEAAAALHRDSRAE